MTLEELNKLKNPEILKIIKENEKESPDSFVLKYSSKKELPLRAIAEQIACRKKAEKKLPEISKHNVLYNSISLEQCSGESAASFKSEIISGNKVLDMTGGLGIDDIYFSKVFNEVHYCELNETISETAKFNFETLKINNIKVHNKDSTVLLNEFPDNYFDWIYLDPARRDANRRSVDLKFCSPNVYELEEQLFKKSQKICIKVSPAFDLTESIRNFKDLKEFIVISVDGECKEVLLILEKDNQEELIIKSVSINSKLEEQFIIEKKHCSIIKKESSKSVLDYIFEPDSAIIKSGLTSKLAVDVGLKFINLNVDYLTGNTQIVQFPGRCFEIQKNSMFKPLELKSYLKNSKIQKANLAKRDFPLSVEELRKKFKIKEGGEDYFFFTKDYNENLIYIHAKKLNYR